MTGHQSPQANPVDKDALIRDLRDQIDYLEAQLLDQDIQFPGNWRLSPNEKRLLRHLLKRPLVTKESAMAVLYHARGGDEPEVNTMRVYIGRLRRALSPLGFQIETHRREGYSMARETRDKIVALCAGISPNGEVKS